MIKLFIEKTSTRARTMYYDWKYMKGGKEPVRINHKNALAWYPLVDPYKFGNFEAGHRICIAPLTMLRAKYDNHSYSPMQVEFYKLRLKAGSVVFSEAMAVSKQACISLRVCGMFTDEHEETIKELFDIATENGALFIPQLTHGGKVCPNTVTSEPLSCDGVPQQSKPPKNFPPEEYLVNGEAYTFADPIRMDNSHMRQVISEFVQSAERLKRAGATVCNLCMGGNSLLHSFILSSTNTRTDGYGGTSINRIKFPLQVFDAVEKVFGKGNVGISMSFGFQCSGNIDNVKHDFKTHILMANELTKRKAHHYTYWFRYEGQGTAPATDDFVEAYGKWEELRSRLRSEFKGPMIASGFSTKAPEVIVEQIVSGKADMVMMGLGSLCNPDLVNKIRHGVSHEKNFHRLMAVPRIKEDSELKDWSEADQARGYIDWPIADLPDEPPQVIHL
eukprot:TRINITY_DN2694_c0_g1_i4.p1 TRINITY_DN2694_c0_g1~~TRINITY_DN2694_c0_g1_i4.p1  ORF type:complete len:446 (+),score=52.78 TRINITY_DN2694_c0_g1_i4:116-1453(+)